MVDTKFEIDDISIYKRICGFKDKNIAIIEKIFDVKIIPRGNTLIVDASADNTAKALQLLHLMTDHLYLRDSIYEFDDFDIRYLAQSINQGITVDADEINRLKILIAETGKTIVPKTMNQAKYMSAIHKNPVTISIGPAGTGKTYLAVAVGVKLLLTSRVERIILTRPAVEAGESLGYLPGDFIQKINPYLRPLYDALFDILPYERISKYMEKGIIEIAPLAYMRGRTLNKAFIILDEAQNTTTSQMKMFLTRLGNNSKMVISGDITQIDLEKPRQSGLLAARAILRGIDEIAFIEFLKEDICRHPIVEKIIAAYEKHAE